jgi:exodeoxyribonuclease VIII
MIDIETLGTKTTAPILSIGAVRFSPTDAWDHEPWERFSVIVDLETSTYGGGVVELSTLKWWLAPERLTVRNELFIKTRGVDLQNALDGLRIWIGDEAGPTWANSPTFDLAILARAMTALGVEVPWTYRQERDYRTVLNLTTNHTKMMADEKIKSKFDKLRAHSAVDDAEWQTRMLLYIASLKGLEIA